MKQFHKCRGFAAAAGILLFICISLLPSIQVKAADSAAAVSFGEVDYDRLTMIVNRNGNAIVYFSSDKKTWYEIEGERTAGNTGYVMDISWVPDTKDTEIYFKGDVVKTIVSVTLPAKNNAFKVIYNKADGDFEFQEGDEAVTYEWRKSVDYKWHTVTANPNAGDYKLFLREVDNMLVKGGKIIFRIPQIKGRNGDDTGARASREYTVSLTKRSNAPGVKVNPDKLTINTTDKMEYYKESTGKWVECDRNMPLSDIVPQVLYQHGARSTTLKIRTQATESKTYSKTAILEINGQGAPLVIGDSRNDCTYWYQNGKLVLQFGNASSDEPYSYTVVKKGMDFDVATASWRSVKSSKPLTLTRTTAPEDCTIYVRKSGKALSASKGIELELASDVKSFHVDYN